MINFHKEVDRCGLCPGQIFDDNDDPEKWGKYWCQYIDLEVDPIEIHKDCPFDDKNKLNNNGG